MKYSEFALPLLAFALGVWLLIQIKNEVETGALRLKSGGKTYRKEHPNQFLFGIVIQSVIAGILIIYPLVHFSFLFL
jgi:hypothetical protein